MSPEDAKTIGDAFKALDEAVIAKDAAALAVKKARAGIGAINDLMAKSLPVAQPVHIPGTQYTVTLANGGEIVIHRDTPVLTLEDLAK